MKNLKRILSLALVLFICLGAFSLASATSFTDDDAVQYQEAVNVMTGIGAINGYNGGSFRPNGTITRMEAAKMVAYTILGAEAAEALTDTDSSFTDMGSGDAWAVPSIEYLVSIGAINGIGDGKFNPYGSVTGQELGKMLLCALGYGKNNEYVGSNWSTNAEADAGKARIFAGRATDASALGSAATREEAALFCFNAIQQAYVKYANSSGEYTKEGKLMTSIYPTLAKSEASLDVFGRPVNQWVYGTSKKVISLCVPVPILTYSTGVTVVDLLNDLENIGFEIDKENGISIFHNDDTMLYGYTYDQLIAAISTGAGYTSYIGGNGVFLQVYGDAAIGSTAKACITTNYAATATITAEDDPATSADERRITVSLFNGKPTPNDIIVEPSTPGFDATYAALAAAGKPLTVLVTPRRTFGSGYEPPLNMLVPTDPTIVHTIAVAKTATLTPVSFIAEGTPGDCFTTADGSTYYYYDTFSGFTGSTVADLDPVNVVFCPYGYIIHCGKA